MNPQEPIAEAVVEAQKAEAEVETPIAEAVVKAQKAEAEVETPRAEAVVDAPDAKTVVEAPRVEAVSVAPNAEAVSVAPNAEDVSVAPNAEAVAVAPNAEDAVAKRDSWMIMKQKIKNMQQTNKTVAGEIKTLQEEKETLENFLRSYHQIKTDFLDSLCTRRNAARKVVAASLVVSLSSLTVGLRCSAKAALRDALPWTIGIGATSLAFSLVFSKDVWLSFKDYSWWKNMRLPVMDTQRIPEISIEDPVPEVMLLHTSMPDCSVTFCVGDKELEARRRKRINSI